MIRESKKAKLSELVADLDLKTLDQIAGADAKRASEAPDEKVRGQAIRWTQRRRDIFNFLGPMSISLVATDGPISVTLWDPGGGIRERIGHNRAIWPARVVNGSAMRDAATTTWNKFPLAFLGTQARLWTLREADRDRLSHSVVDLIAERSDEAEREGGRGLLKQGFRDLGPDLDLAFFEMEMHGIGERLGMLTWDDDNLVRWFDAIGRRFDAIKAERPEIRWGERVVARIAERDVEQMKQAKGWR